MARPTIPTLTLAEAAGELGITREGVKQLVKRGKLAAQRVAAPIRPHGYYLVVRRDVLDAEKRRRGIGIEIAPVLPAEGGLTSRTL